MGRLLLVLIVIGGLLVLLARRAPTEPEASGVDVVGTTATEGGDDGPALLQGRAPREEPDPAPRDADVAEAPAPAPEGETEVDAAASVTAGSDLEPLLEPVYVRVDPASPLSVLSIDVTQLAQGDGQASFFWRLELKNDATSATTPDLVLEYLDADGEVVDDAQVGDLSVAAQSTRVVEGTSRPRGTGTVRRLRVRQR